MSEAEYTDLEAVRKALRYECEAAVDGLMADIADGFPPDGPAILAVEVAPWLVDVIRSLGASHA